MSRPYRWVCAAALVASGCFDGGAARGLPCNDDLDCGLRQRCEQGFCGGPSLLDSTSSDTSAGPSSTSVDPSDSSGSTGSDLCGNEMVDDGEDCDFGGVDTELCDADCTAIECGDGHPNPFVEECDDGNKDGAFDGCSDTCTVPLFADAMDPEPDLDLWQPDSAWARITGGWGSGPYPGTDPAMVGLEGQALLRTIPIEIPADPLRVYRLDFQHQLQLNFGFNVAPDDKFTDGARIAIDDGRSITVAPAELGDAFVCDMLDDEGCHPNRWDGLAYCGRSDGARDASVVLPDSATGLVITLVFEFAYDCGLFVQNPAPLNAWQIYRVAVYPETPDPPQG